MLARLALALLAPAARAGDGEAHHHLRGAEMKKPTARVVAPVFPWPPDGSEPDCRDELAWASSEGLNCAQVARDAAALRRRTRTASAPRSRPAPRRAAPATTRLRRRASPLVDPRPRRRPDLHHARRRGPHRRRRTPRLRHPIPRRRTRRPHRAPTTRRGPTARRPRTPAPTSPANSNGAKPRTRTE